MGGRLDIVMERVRELLEIPADARRAPSRDRIESTLTEGYAEALALDGERLRLARQIDQITARLARGEENHPEELRRLMARTEATEQDLARLRALLATLRNRAVRAA
ncbi:MAG: hypothetical protein H0V11_03325 [Actinobacteria bacterium]|nr:hypothetical protein [Actinomycetota bacterium]